MAHKEVSFAALCSCRLLEREIAPEALPEPDRGFFFGSCVVPLRVAAADVRAFTTFVEAETARWAPLAKSLAAANPK
jgi:hypothetical protein